MTGPRACDRCLLPETMPGVVIGEDGLCTVCAATPSAADLADRRLGRRTAVDTVIAARRGARPYEVIVAFSGGKDSSFTLRHLVVERGLRCLAVTIDNGFLSTDTFANCKAVCGALGVDHLLFTPSSRFVERMYRVSVEDGGLHPPAATRRASAICLSCIMLINTHVLQKAIELGVPMVAGGYLAGQVPADGAVMMLRPRGQARIRAASVDRLAASFGEDARDYFELRVPDDADAAVAVINPMLGIELSEQEVIEAIVPLGWVKPRDTGLTSTNCRLNDLGVYLHSRRHGFHPYALEVAEQLRHGTLSRADAERKLGTVPTQEEVRWLADRLHLSPDVC
jgi:tRNA(Ile)-lysidine synthase TilS/MesJ